MQRKLNWLMVSALAIGGVTFVTAQAQDAQQPAAPAAQQPAQRDLGQPGTLSGDAQRAAAESASLALPAGAKVKESNQKASDYADVVENAAENAVKKGEFDDIVNTLVDQDRNRLGDWKNFDMTTLDGRIEKIRQQFKEKFGDDDIDLDADKVFANAQVVEGEIEDPATFVQNWPVKNMMGGDAQTAGAAAGRDQGAAQATDANRATGNVSDRGASGSVKVGDTTASGQVGTDAAPAGSKTVDDDTRTQGNIEKGRNIAVLRLPAQGDAGDINVSLIRELTGWKIDIPNDRDLKKVSDDLLKHLTHVSDNAASWPADKDQAKGLIARHVLMGLYGIDMPQRKS